MPLLDIDRKLLERCLAQETGAWHEFVERYIGLFYHVVHHVAHARSVLFSQQDVEDIVAEIFLTLIDDDFRALRNFQRQCALPTYLAVIGRRVCVRETVRRQREAELGHSSSTRIKLLTEEGAEDDLDAETIENLLDKLPERDAEIVRLFHLESQSYKEISKSLGIPENSIGPILNRSLKKLRKLAEEA